jgi:hypothetical protein
MENISLKKILIYGLSTGIILLVIPIIIYGFHFHWNNLSNNTSDWGAFSDFVGGILNPIFSIFNILILIFLTIKVSNWDANREKESLEREYRLRNYELMYSALKDFGVIFSKFGERINSSYKCKSPLEFGLLRFEFEALVTVNKRHFNYLGNPENVKKIVDNIVRVTNNLDSLYKDNSKRTEFMDGEALYNEFKKLFEDYGSLLYELRLEVDLKFNEMKK